MSLAILALLALVVIIVISAIRTDLNTGVLAVALAYVVGVYFVDLSERQRGIHIFARAARVDTCWRDPAVRNGST